MKISVVSFDLTGTLLRPFPSLGEICVAAMKAQNFAEIPSVETFNARRSQARRAAQANGHSPTSEARSRLYWRAMLWEIFAGSCKTAPAFENAVEFVYESLARPEHWKLMPGVESALATLKFLGVKTVVLSNGDSRWKKALADKNLDGFFEEIFVSAETGFAKPDTAAFDNICRACAISRGELLHVGDTLAEDIEPAMKFGASALWVTRRPDGLPPPGAGLIETLDEVPEFVRGKIVEEFEEKNLTQSARNMIANLRGLPEENVFERNFDGAGNRSARAKKIFARSEKRLDRAEMDVPPAAPLFKKVLVGKGIYATSLQTRITQSWHEIVPARFADRSRPSALEHGMSVLTIHCENATIRSELEFQKSAILGKIRAMQGGERVKKIVFTLS